MEDLLSKKLDALDLFLSACAVGAGAYHGFCNAKNIPIENKGLEFGLTYGPAIAHGAAGIILGRLTGFMGGSIPYSAWLGVVSGVRGGVLTMAGYGLGYLAGKITQ